MCVSVAKRDADDSHTLAWYVNTLIDNIRKIPRFGDDVADYLDWLASEIIYFDTITDGSLTKLINGILPCKVGLEGLTCTGLSENGGLRNLLIRTLNDIPSSLLTQLVLGVVNSSVHLIN